MMGRGSTQEPLNACACACACGCVCVFVCVCAVWCGVVGVQKTHANVEGGDDDDDDDDDEN